MLRCRRPAHWRLAWLLSVALIVGSRDRDSIPVVLGTTGNKSNINPLMGCTEAAWQGEGGGGGVKELPTLYSRNAFAMHLRVT